jgi:hypothetical protein
MFNGGRNMKNKKGLNAEVFLVLAACSFVAAVIFLSGPLKYLGGMWLCIGSMNLIIGLNKKKKG